MNRSFFLPGNLSTRFLCYFGQTGDLFVDELLYPQDKEYSLHRQLKAAGYERVVFYGYSRGAYFLDAESRDLWHGRKEKKTAQSLFDGPKLKGRLSARATPDRQNRKPMSFQVGAQEMLRYAETFLKDTTIRTAVVFPNGVEALKEFADLDRGRLLDNFFVEVTQGGLQQTANTNIAVFVFNRTPRQIQEFLAGPARESLRNYLLTKAYATRHDVGIPGKGELRRMLNYLRLYGDGTSRLRVDCGRLEEISHMLARTLAANYARVEEDVEYDPRRLQCWTLRDTLKYLKRWFLETGRCLDLESCREICRRSEEAPALERLEGLIGMSGLKKNIRSFVAFARNMQHAAAPEAHSRLDRGPAPEKQEQVNLHMVLTGSQGTGKTTAAKLIGEILCEAGLLSTGQTVKITPGELLKDGGYAGQIQQNLIQAMERAMGGVLFIDEAYGLAQPEASGIVDQLLTEMQERNGRVCVILAGYPRDMEELLEKGNPGLKGRFANKILQIDDYSVEELGQIFRYHAGKKRVSLSGEMEAMLPEFLENLYYDRRQDNWQNGREMETLLEKILVKHPGALVLEPAMIPGDYAKYTTRRVEEDALAQVEAMVGLTQVKEEIRKLRRRMRNGRITGTPHFLFAGPPGTGKTTVARYMGMILKNLGVLKRGHLVEVKPKDMVMGYVGQTPEHTRKIFDSALDGVLFIDEAHRMIPGRGNFYGEVLDVLMEYTADNSRKGNLCVICAGYEDGLQELLQQDAGLSRRIKNWIHFESYRPEELMGILERSLEADGLRADPAYLEAARREFTEHFAAIAEKYNASYVADYRQASVDLLDERLEQIYGDDVPEEEKQILTGEDAPASGAVLKERIRKEETPWSTQTGGSR